MSKNLYLTESERIALSQTLSSQGFVVVQKVFRFFADGGYFALMDSDSLDDKQLLRLRERASALHHVTEKALAALTYLEQQEKATPEATQDLLADLLGIPN